MQISGGKFSSRRNKKTKGHRGEETHYVLKNRKIKWQLYLECSEPRWNDGVNRAISYGALSNLVNYLNSSLFLWVDWSLIKFFEYLLWASSYWYCKGKPVHILWKGGDTNKQWQSSRVIFLKDFINTWVSKQTLHLNYCYSKL